MNKLVYIKHNIDRIDDYAQKAEAFRRSPAFGDALAKLKANEKVGDELEKEQEEARDVDECEDAIFGAANDVLGSDAEEGMDYDDLDGSFGGFDGVE